MSWEFIQRNIGNRLTPELAQGLVNSIQMIMSGAWREGYDTACRANSSGDSSATVDFDAEETIGDYRLRVSSIEKEHPRILEMHKEHFAELESVRNPGVAFNPRYDLWVSWERNKQFFFFLLEFKGEPVGNIGVYTSLSKTNSTLVASEQFIYLKKAHRKGWMGMRLLRFAERVLKDAGVRELVFSSHPAKDTSVFYKRAGYAPGGTIYMKILK